MLDGARQWAFDVKVRLHDGRDEYLTVFWTYSLIQIGAFQAINSSPRLDCEVDLRLVGSQLSTFKFPVVYMTNIQALVAKVRQRRAEELAAYRARISLAASHGVEYDEKRRPENLRILRAYFNANQDEFAELVRIRSQSEYSGIERGLNPLTAESARQIERDLGIPENWLDRNNSESIFLSLGEVSLINELRRVPSNAAIQFANAIKELMKGGTQD